jgi:hypothetical protein
MNNNVVLTTGKYEYNYSNMKFLKGISKSQAQRKWEGN